MLMVQTIAVIADPQLVPWAALSRLHCHLARAWLPVLIVNIQSLKSLQVE
jgi:hypothetical protein